ncbi:MAG: carbohydrate-binding domain-containing protein [Candidatus Woesearchaeota archaeon]
MEDNSIYNAIIVSLIVGIVIVISTLVIARPDPERFTELYFDDHNYLDKYSYDGKHDFSFTIHNLEGERMVYDYEVKVDDEIVKEAGVVIENDGFAEVHENVEISVPFDRAKIEVSLVEKDQEIHFWVEYTDKIWMEYDGKEDGAISCLPANTIKKGDLLIVKMRGAQADGWPVMEVWVNGKKENEIEITGSWKEYLVYGPVENDAIIDLAFVNNYGVKEDDVLVWDRNIYVAHVRTLEKYLEYVYDINEWDCEDLREGDMFWNGALRFRAVVE